MRHESRAVGPSPVLPDPKVASLLARARRLKAAVSESPESVLPALEEAIYDPEVATTVLGFPLSASEVEAWDVVLSADDAAYIGDVLAGKYENLDVSGVSSVSLAHDEFIKDLPPEFENVSALL